jgi:hypothetical protein
MKAIKTVIAIFAWFAATYMLAVLALDAMEWEQEQNEKAAQAYREQMDQELVVEYAVYEAKR